MEAFVSCTCRRQGTARPHPHANFVEESAPGVIRLSPRATEAMVEAHEEWLSAACSHSLMQEAYAFVHGLDAQSLIQALFQPGGPAAGATTLAAVLLAEGDPPSTSPEQAASLIAEIEGLRTSLEHLKMHQVVDARTDEVLFETPGLAVYSYMGDGSRLEVGPEGIRMVRGEKVLFTTRSLAQEEAPDGATKLTPAGGAAVKSHGAFMPYDAENPENPREMPSTVEHQEKEVGFPAVEPYLEPVLQLARASLRTGNHIVWTGNDALGM